MVSIQQLAISLANVILGQYEGHAIPLHKQLGDTCAVASLLSAILIWNADQKRSQNEDPIIVDAFNLLLIYLEKDEQKNTIIDMADDDDSTTYDAMIAQIIQYRDSLQSSRLTCTEEQYQSIVNLIYNILRFRGIAHKSLVTTPHMIFNLASGVSRSGFLHYNDIWGDSIIQGLNAGDIAQVGWFTLEWHTLLVGRLRNDEWFWYDQAGIDKAFMFRASTLSELRSEVNNAVSSGRYSQLHRGTQPVVGIWTGVILLERPNKMAEALKNIVPAGSMLAEVDAPGTFNFGEKVYAKGFESRHYNLNEALNVANGFSSNGALIVEKPKDVFSVYKTNLVSDSNAQVTEIDTADSEEGLLSNQSLFHRAWLRVNSGNKSHLFQVY